MSNPAPCPLDLPPEIVAALDLQHVRWKAKHKLSRDMEARAAPGHWYTLAVITSSTVSNRVTLYLCPTGRRNDGKYITRYFFTYEDASLYALSWWSEQKELCAG